MIWIICEYAQRIGCWMNQLLKNAPWQTQIEHTITSQASMIWIIGEYAERIDNADELLESFLETFPEETSVVSLLNLDPCIEILHLAPCAA